MLKIYTYARKMITSIFLEMFTIHGFSTPDITWKVLQVEEEIVVFKISDKIKQLMEAELPAIKGGFISFKKNDGYWEATVSANGVESYFFARVLFAALARIKNGNLDLHAMNKSIIELYTRATFPNTKGTQLGMIIDVGQKRDRRYFMTIPIEGVDWTFYDKNVDVLCKDIGVKLRGQIRCWY